MGSIQTVISWINDKYELELDLLAEAYSVLFASLPYKMLFLDIDATWLAIAVLTIKGLYKTTAFLILPVVRYYLKNRQASI